MSSFACSLRISLVSGWMMSMNDTFSGSSISGNPSALAASIMLSGNPGM